MYGNRTDISPSLRHDIYCRKPSLGLAIITNYFWTFIAAQQILIKCLIHHYCQEKSTNFAAFFLWTLFDIQLVVFPVTVLFFFPEFVEHFKFPATHQALFFYEYQQTFCLAVSQTFQRHHTRFRTRDGHIWCAEFYSDIVFSLTFIEQFNITEFSATSLRWLHSHHLFSNIANLQTPRLFMFIQRYQVG